MLFLDLCVRVCGCVEKLKKKHYLHYLRDVLRNAIGLPEC